MKAIELIAEERERQISKGFDAYHDNSHYDRSLLTAAKLIIDNAECDFGLTVKWPKELLKHIRVKYNNDEIKQLTIAAAFIIAEIERLQRLEATNV